MSVVQARGGEAVNDLNLEGLTDAQLRLFAVRCACRVQHLMTDPRSLVALDVAERYARGEATDKELSTAWAAAWDAANAAEDAAEDAATAAASEAAWAAAWAAEAAAEDAAGAAAGAASRAAALDAERAEQKKILDKIREVKP